MKSFPTDKRHFYRIQLQSKAISTAKLGASPIIFPILIENKCFLTSNGNHISIKLLYEQT